MTRIARFVLGNPGDVEGSAWGEHSLEKEGSLVGCNVTESTPQISHFLQGNVSLWSGDHSRNNPYVVILGDLQAPLGGWRP